MSGRNPGATAETSLALSVFNATVKVHKQRVTTCDATLADDAFMGFAEWFFIVSAVILVFGGIYLSQVIPARWHKYMQATFDALDTDNTRSLSEAELYTAVLEMYHRLPVRCPPPAKNDFAIMFHQVDLNGNGQVDFDEFDEMLTALAISTTFRCLMIIAAQVLSPVMASAVYFCGTSHPATLAALPVWLKCFGLTVEDTLGVRAFLTIILFILSKGIALPVANMLILLVTECCMRSHSNRDVSPGAIRKRLAEKKTSVTAVDPSPLLTSQ